MRDMIKGRFVFIPDDGSAPFEIEMEDLREAKPLTLWDRFRLFIQSFSRKEEPTPLLPAVSTEPNIPKLVCGKLEELFCTAVWYYRDEHMFEEPKPSYLMDVFPREHSEGWEPVVRLASAAGTPREVSLAELLTYYMPLDPSDEHMHSS